MIIPKSTTELNSLLESGSLVTLDEVVALLGMEKPTIFRLLHQQDFVRPSVQYGTKYHYWWSLAEVQSYQGSH